MNIGLEKKRNKDTTDALKALISQFQEETKSNSVLDFITWYENFSKRYVENLKNEQRRMI